ncbi:hypothetical protein B0H34DRAFT_726830 [Crassisporium funariophilum]|nr:hypothetical protein B0H34DRAFT_726830 [Crassisporium funariophilum]
MCPMSVVEALMTALAVSAALAKPHYRFRFILSEDRSTNATDFPHQKKTVKTPIKDKGVGKVRVHAQSQGPCNFADVAIVHKGSRRA